MPVETIRSMRARMRSIASTQKIARAMFSASSAKLRRAQERMRSSSEFKLQAAEILQLLPAPKTADGKTCRIVVAGDRGMSGGYNNAVLASLKLDDGSLYLPIGRKAYEKINAAGMKMIPEEMILSENISLPDLKAYLDEISGMIRKENIAQVEIIYTAYDGTIRSETLFPQEANQKASGVIIFETSPEEILADTLGGLLAGIVYACVCEANACEHLQRRMAMDTAQKNAEQMLEEMKIKLNRRRRAGITQEIIEAVSGSNANGENGYG